ncbi:RHS repeat-associated core domain-containing protein [Algimonas porphyrae]|uniref:RHS repeat-associated core domain-containing protein n=1 Tax=Algimonas porphyrae TaxID=1128113 RepID=UPI0024E0BBCD|nr:RHS repeat-associated core domain-containing protein [Algimonas porphyrae]
MLATGPGANPGSNCGVTGFTSHVRDCESGLQYMQARHYSPVSARFLSVDPVTFMETGMPGMFNRYGYTLGDPINMWDPDGKSPLRDHYYSTGSGTLPSGMKSTGSSATGSVIGDAKIAIGAAIIFADIATLPSGEGVLGSMMISSAVKNAAADAAIGGQ